MVIPLKARGAAACPGTVWNADGSAVGLGVDAAVSAARVFRKLVAVDEPAEWRSASTSTAARGCLRLRASFGTQSCTRLGGFLL